MKSAAEREKYRAQFDGIDFRAHPEKYRVGRGEEGVLSAEPYKSELLPHWRFKTPDVAEESARKIYQMFLDYLAAEDFVGADMARKFLQMGYTRSRRYANHRSGKNTTARFPKTFAEFPALTVARNCRNKLTKKKPNPPADFTLITNAPKKTPNTGKCSPRIKKNTDESCSVGKRQKAGNCFHCFLPFAYSTAN